MAGINNIISTDGSITYNIVNGIADLGAAVKSLVSSDSSVVITEPTPGNFDLSCNCCCPDTDLLVAVGPGDDAGYLAEQIEVVDPLMKTILNPGSSNQILQFSIDTSFFDNPDLNNKVGVDSGCTPVFLENAVSADIGLVFDKVSCSMQVGLDATNSVWKRPRAGNNLVDTVKIQQLTGLELSYYFSTTAVPTLDSAGFIHETPGWLNIGTGSLITNSGGVITINKPGPYRMAFTGRVELNRGCHAFRIGIIIIRGASQVKLLEERFSGLSDLNRINNTVTSQGGGGETYTMADSIERRGTSGSRLFQLQTGDQLVPYFKLSTVMFANPEGDNITGELSVLGDAESTGGGDNGFSFDVDFVGDII